MPTGAHILKISNRQKFIYMVIVKIQLIKIYFLELHLKEINSEM